jgi:hypothetical protein
MQTAMLFARMMAAISSVNHDRWRSSSAWRTLDQAFNDCAKSSRRSTFAAQFDGSCHTTAPSLAPSGAA